MHSHFFSKLTIIFLVLIVFAACITFSFVKNATFASSSSPSGSQIVATAQQIKKGEGAPINGWPGNKKVTYSWGAGHTSLGPSLGKCKPLPKSAKPSDKPDCTATKIVGIDCSGFTRWVYYLAYNNNDVLTNAGTKDQINVPILQKRELDSPDSPPQAGDLVFFAHNSGSIYHVGIYIGNGQMIDAPHTGEMVRQESVGNFTRKAGKSIGKVAGYYYIPKNTPTPTPNLTPTVTPIPTLTPTVTSTVSPTIPQLASSYTGTVHLEGSISVTGDFGISITQEDQQGNFSGQGVGLHGPLTGTVGSDDTINFTIKSTDTPGNLLIFSGTVVIQNSIVNTMSGTYTVEDPSDPAGAGTGTWQASVGTCGTGCG